jgi:hypothetical protein
MDTHKNAPLTRKGREMMVRAVVDCARGRADETRCALRSAFRSIG